MFNEHPVVLVTSTEVRHKVLQGQRYIEEQALFNSDKNPKEKNDNKDTIKKVVSSWR